MAPLYGFAYTEAALKYLETKVPNKIRGQIKKRIGALSATPIPASCKKLIGVMDGTYPDDKIVAIQKTSGYITSIDHC